MASDNPDRLAELSRRLTEAGIKHGVWRDYEKDQNEQPDAGPILTIDVGHGGTWLTVHPQGEWWLPDHGDHSEPIWPKEDVTRAIVIVAEVFGR